MDTKFQSNLFFSILFLSGFSLLYFFLPKITGIINRAENTPGGKFETYIIILGILVFFYFIILFIKKDFKKLFLILLLFLPGISRFQKIFAIQAYKNYVIPPLTLIIFILLIFILLHKNYKLRTKTEKQFEKLLWTFAITGTLTQFINHSFFSAFWLSIGAFWQWVALFYILSAILTEKKYAIKILKYIPFAIIIGIVFRIGSGGQTFLNILTGSQRFRVSSTFGPAVSYGGYLAIVAISIFYIIKVADTKNKKIFWVIIFLIIFNEMLQTMTRGAYIAFSLFILLFIWKTERRHMIIILSAGVLSVPIIWKYIYALITYRQFSIVGIGNIPGVYQRFFAWQQNLPKIFTHYGLGNGIGKVEEITFGPGIYLTPHNMLLSMCQQIGFFSTLFFIIMYIFVIKKGIQNSLIKIKYNMYPYLVVMLIAFFIFANTTNTSILAYYPYSSILIFYLFFFFTIFMQRFINSNDKKIFADNNLT